MAEERLMWSSPYGNAETVTDGAERFVRETFGCERRVVWGETPGEFRFADGMWRYRISAEAGWWYVRRTDRKTPKGEAYCKARRRGRGDDPHTPEGTL